MFLNHPLTIVKNTLSVKGAFGSGSMGWHDEKSAIRKLQIYIRLSLIYKVGGILKGLYSILSYSNDTARKISGFYQDHVRA